MFAKRFIDTKKAAKNYEISKKRKNHRNDDATCLKCQTYCRKFSARR